MERSTPSLPSPYTMHALMDSLEAPWKIAKERKKSAMKMATSEITTADVVDSPTPFAPPWVVIPQEQLTLDMIAPKTTDLSIRAKMSDFWRALEAESKITFGPTSYTKSGSRERIAGERQTGFGEAKGRRRGLTCEKDGRGNSHREAQDGEQRERDRARDDPGRHQVVHRVRAEHAQGVNLLGDCLLYTSPSPRDVEESRMPSSA